MSLVVGIALTASEQELVIRAVRDLAGSEDVPQPVDVLDMLTNALEVGAIELLKPDSAWWK